MLGECSITYKKTLVLKVKETLKRHSENSKKNAYKILSTDMLI